MRRHDDLMLGKCHFKHKAHIDNLKHISSFKGIGELQND